MDGGVFPAIADTGREGLTLHRALLLLVCLLIPFSASAEEAEHVVVVSIDGLLPAYYLEPDHYGLEIPTLRRLTREGAYAHGMRTVFPSVTYAVHTSMVTGVPPKQHGIFMNPAADPQMEFGLRWYVFDVQTKTVYQAAKEQGLRTGLVYWPATLGARADANFPEFWRGDRDDHKLLRAISTPGLVEGVRERFPGFHFDSPARDETLTDVTVHIIHSVRPNLLLLHIFRVDFAHHEHGPGSPEALAAVEVADRQLGRVVAALEQAGLWSRTTLFVVSDHGFAPIEKTLKPGVLLRRNDLLEVDEYGQIIEWQAAPICSGAVCEILVRDSLDQGARARLQAMFAQLAGDPASGVGRLYGPEETALVSPDKGAFLLLEAAPGFAMSHRILGELIEPASSKATHGYDPDRPEMLASFIVTGSGVERRRLDKVSILDLAPTIAHLLGVEMPDMEGQVLEEIFEPVSKPAPTGIP